MKKSEKANEAKKENEAEAQAGGKTITIGRLLSLSDRMMKSRRIKLRDGGKSYRLLKALMRYEEEIEKFQKFRDEQIKAVGKLDEKTGEIGVEKSDPEYAPLMKTLNEAAAETVSLASPIFTPDDIDGSVSADELEVFDLLALIAE